MKVESPHKPPLLPGVYLFKNAFNEIIYIGKAKILAKRVQSYFNKAHKDWKVKALIDEHANIEYIVTKTEHEALLLEAQLISTHKPKYNVLLKSGQPFVYLMITHEELPRLLVTRNKKEEGTYFGPFLHKSQARSAHRYLMETFKLGACNQKIPGGCLNYHLNLCPGTCRDSFDVTNYHIRVATVIGLLKGDYNTTLRTLKQHINEYSKNLEFEKAKNLSFYLQNLQTIFETLKARFRDTKYQNEIDQTTAPRIPVESSQALHELQKLLKLDQLPYTIDCFDISHFQSNELVGSCVRFTHGLPDKNNFRRFKIKTLTTQNDYAALQEIVARRYKDPQDVPDLIVIDGGKGQLSAVQQIIPSAICISLAKREERIFGTMIPHEGIVLDPHTEHGKLLIALRDYAHHFAINYHRLRRIKKVTT